MVSEERPVSEQVPDLEIEVTALCPACRQRGLTVDCRVDADGWECRECGRTWDLEGRRGAEPDEPREERTAPRDSVKVNRFDMSRPDLPFDVPARTSPEGPITVHFTHPPVEPDVIIIPVRDPRMPR